MSFLRSVCVVRQWSLCLFVFDWGVVLFDGQWCCKNKSPSNKHRWTQHHDLLCSNKQITTHHGGPEEVSGRPQKSAFCALALCTGSVCWLCVLVLCTGSVYWLCVPALRTGSVSWLCVLALCSGSVNCSVYWLCVIIGSV